MPLSIPVGAVVDDSPARQELAIEHRELGEALADTVRWLAARGLVTAPRVGLGERRRRLAPSPVPTSLASNSVSNNER